MIDKRKLKAELATYVPKCVSRHLKRIRKSAEPQLLIGVGGSGLGYVSKCLILKTFIAGDKVILFDPDGEYGKFIEPIEHESVKMTPNISIPDDFHFLHVQQEKFTLRPGTADMWYMNIFHIIDVLSEQKTRKKPVWLFVKDAGYLLENSTYGPKEFLYLLKRAKDNNIIITLTTQVLGRFAGDPDGKILLQNVRHAILLHMLTMDVENFVKTYHMPDSYREMNNQLYPCFGFLYTDEELQTIEFSYSIDSYLYSLIVRP